MRYAAGHVAAKPRKKIEMLRVGLTGGIACGKSTVAEMFRELGYPVLDADLVAHEMLAPGDPTHDAVLREFEGIENLDGSISRPKLAAIVFADKTKLARLNAIMHPEIARRMAKWFSEQGIAGGAGFCDLPGGIAGRSRLQKPAGPAYRCQLPSRAAIGEIGGARIE